MTVVEHGKVWAGLEHFYCASSLLKGRAIPFDAKECGRY